MELQKLMAELKWMVIQKVEWLANEKLKGSWMVGKRADQRAFQMAGCLVVRLAFLTDRCSAATMAGYSAVRLAA